MRKVNVVGYRYHDIVIYVAQILAALGTKVYVNDLSSKWDMYHYVPKIAGIQTGYPIQICGVTYGFGRQKAPEGTDFLMNLFDPEQCLGENPYEADSNDLLVIVTDEEPAREISIERVFGYHDFDEEHEKNATIIFRDYSSVNSSFCENTREALRQGQLVELPYSKKDREAEVFLWSREDNLYKPISERMASLVEMLVCKLRPETTVAEFERAYKVALKGGSL